MNPTTMNTKLELKLIAVVFLSLIGFNAFAENAKPASLIEMNTATVADTLKVLQKDSSRRFVDHNGWLVAEKRIEGGSELWSFTPEDHEAYPAAVQRLITDGKESLAIEMNIQCDAPTDACDRLTELFTVMNENLIAVSKSAPGIIRPPHCIDNMVHS